MNHLNLVVSSTKKFIYRHKTGLAVTVTALTCLALNRTALVAHDNFLKENNLYEKFYTPEG